MEKYFFELSEKRKQRHKGQKTNIPKTWRDVLKIKKTGFVYSSRNENSCGDDTINWDGIKSPKSIKIRKSERTKIEKDLSLS